MSNFKPCPFCGKKPEIEGKLLKHITKLCPIGEFRMIVNSEEQALEIWNHRYKTEEKETSL